MAFGGQVWLSIVMCASALVAPAAGATGDARELEAQGPSFLMIEENDALTDADRHYTQGIKLAYFHAEGVLPFALSNVIPHLPAWGFREMLPRVGYDLGQNIYTPSDLASVALVLDDRPFAGWLYTGIIIQRRGRGWWEQPMLESIEAEFGVVGRWSQAEQAQDFFHSIIGFKQPQGWRNQLHNEVGILLKYSRSLRLSLWQVGPVGSDLIPQGGFSLGNINTSARAGVTCRVGLRLPDDFGSQTIDSLQTAGAGKVSGHGLQASTYVFGRAEGRAVAWNEFLDGNFFRPRHHVTRDPWVADLLVGAVVAVHHLEFGYTHTFRSREFISQKDSDSFSSFYGRVRF